MTDAEPHDPPSTRALRGAVLGESSDGPSVPADLHRRTAFATERIIVPVLPSGGRRHAHAYRSTETDGSTGPLLAAEHPISRRVPRRTRLLITGLIAAVLVLGSATAVTAAITAGALADPAQLTAPGGAIASNTEAAPVPPQPAPVQALPVPSLAVTGSVGGALAHPCDSSEITDALAVGDDDAVVAAVGGGETLRSVVAAGSTCLRLDDPARIWTVVNKTRPFEPTDYAPAALALPSDVRSLEGEQLRTDAASALTALVQASRVEGAGDIALESGYRSFTRQQRNFGSGGAAVEASVARPGYSEHQSGLAADVVACDDRGCSTMDDLADTSQGAWIAANAWRFGWIVRYEDGRTDVTGYIPEPWHLRHIGTDLAAAYHAGGWNTLEEFFGLSAAPTY